MKKTEQVGKAVTLRQTGFYSMIGKCIPLANLKFNRVSILIGKYIPLSLILNSIELQDTGCRKYFPVF